MSESKTERISVRLKKVTADQVRADAMLVGLTISELIRMKLESSAKLDALLAASVEFEKELNRLENE